jgi:perosamine synthetase
VIRVSNSHDDRLALLGGQPQVTNAPEFRWPVVRQEDADEVARMALAGELSYYGREGHVQELEDKFSSYLGGVRALATTSGTTALHSAFFALGLEPGDEVLAPSYTFFATVMPLFVVNAIPVLVDVEPDTGNIDPADIERHITDRTRAIVVVHLWGNPVDMAAVMSIARRHDLRVVEDCSHAHGARCQGQPVGTFGDAAVFSLQGKKLVAAGQGGMLVTASDEIFERAVLLGHFNLRAFEDVHSLQYSPYCYEGLGLNYRMHPLAAAIASRQMDRLDSYLAGRNRNFSHLSQGLATVPGIAPPVTRPHVDLHAYYSYKPSYAPDQLGGLPITRFVEAVRAEGVPLVRYDSPPLHLLKVFGHQDPPFISHGRPEVLVAGGKRRAYGPGDFPSAECYVGNLLSLPAYTDDVRSQLDQFIEAFDKVARHADELASAASPD